MDFRRVVGIVRHYWVAALGVLVLTAVAVLLVPRNVSPSFEATGSIILLTPSTVDGGNGEQVDVNPWSRFGGGAEGVASTAIIEVLTSKSTEAQVMADDAVQEYTVVLNPGGNGAIIDISVTATNPEAAIGAYQLVSDLLVAELDDRQEQSGTPKSTWLRAQPLTTPTAAIELEGSEKRAMIAVAALGVVAAVALAVALDALATFRSRGESEPDGSEGSPESFDDRAAGPYPSLHLAKSGANASESASVVKEGTDP